MWISIVSSEHNNNSVLKPQNVHWNLNQCLKTYIGNEWKEQWFELHFPHFPCDVNNKNVIKICNLCAYLISYPLFYMSMYNQSRIIDAKVLKLSLRSMLMGGVEIYPRCAKCVVPEGVRHRDKQFYYTHAFVATAIR